MSGMVFKSLFLGSKLPRGPGKPFQRWGASPPHLLEGFPGPWVHILPPKQRLIKPCPTWGGVCSKLLLCFVRGWRPRTHSSKKVKFTWQSYWKGWTLFFAGLVASLRCLPRQDVVQMPLHSLRCCCLLVKRIPKRQRGNVTLGFHWFW